MLQPQSKEACLARRTSGEEQQHIIRQGVHLAVTRVR